MVGPPSSSYSIVVSKLELPVASDAVGIGASEAVTLGASTDSGADGSGAVCASADTATGAGADVASSINGNIGCCEPSPEELDEGCAVLEVESVLSSTFFSVFSIGATVGLSSKRTFFVVVCGEMESCE